MAVYLVSYDIKQGHGSHDYQDLYDALDAIASRRILQSVFLVSTARSSKKLYEHLLGFMDPKDRLWVSKVRKDEYSYRAMPGIGAWLKANPPGI